VGFKSSKSEVFNVSTGKPMSINDLARCVCRVLRNDLEVQYVEPRAGDIMHSYGDPAKTQKVLGFKAHVDFEEGLKRCVGSLS